MQNELSIEKDQYKEYYLLLFQTEFANLITTRELSSEIFKDIIKNMNKTKLKNNEYMDLYLFENLFSTLLPGLESLCKNIEKLIIHSKYEDKREIDRFNPCNYLGEFLMRHNPKYNNKNKVTHEKFLEFTRKERKNRILQLNNNHENLKKKILKIDKDQLRKEIPKLTKLSIKDYVVKLDNILKLNNNLIKFNWVEYFRKNKDDDTIKIDRFYDSFEKAILDIHSIDEILLKNLLE